MYTAAELVRGCWRSASLIALLLWAGVESPRMKRVDLSAQSRWRQRWARKLLQAMHVRVHVRGTPPHAGLLVSNHLGYLDAVVYGSLIEGTFLSKAEVAHWPLLGPLTRAAGTLFVERGSARSTAAANRQITALLQEERQVLVFPEGTSSGGAAVLPFQSPFFDGPQRIGAPVWAAAIAYRAGLSHGTVADRVCYWGDMVIGPHLFGLLCVREIDATVQFADVALTVADRRAGAAEAHAVVSRLFDRESHAEDLAFTNTRLPHTL